MSMGFITALRTALGQAILDAIDAGAAAGTLKIYSATRPATGAAITSQVLLSEHTLTDPAGSVTAGALDFSAISEDVSANADGTASWARIADSDGNALIDLSVDVTGSGADIEVNTVEFRIGGPVTFTSQRSITIGNL